MDFSPDIKKISKWSGVNNRIFKMYKDSFYRVDPGSLKEIEFKSFRRLEKSSNFRVNSFVGKSIKSKSFLRNHISLTPGTKIVELPMSPFGKHTSYNEEADFKKKTLFGQRVN